MLTSIANRLRNTGPSGWLGLFVVLCVLLRWGSFFISVINHDESTYIVIADEMLRGEVYLLDVIDTKPIGIFWLYMALIELTGGAIPLLRLAATLFVAVGAWGLYLTGCRAGYNIMGIAAGTAYCFICSIFTYYGVSPNTEIYFNLFTIAAIALAVAPRLGPNPVDTFWHWPVAGLLLGLAFIIKPFAAAEALAVGLFALWHYGSSRKFTVAIGAGAALVAGFCVPAMAVYGYYARLGLLDTLRFYLFEVNGAYPIELAWYLRLKYMADYLLRFSPLVLLWALARVQAKGDEHASLKKWLGFFTLQLALVTIVVLLTGKRFGHYQVQLHPPLAALAAAWWIVGYKSVAEINRSRIKRLLPPVLVSFALIMGSVHFFRYGNKTDRPTMIAEYLEPRLGPEETYFGINGWQIAYHLLDRPVPTPYVHSSLLFLDHHVRAFQIDTADVASQLISNESLTYLAGRVEDADADTPLRNRLLQHFAPVDTLQGEVVMYRRIQ